MTNRVLDDARIDPRIKTMFADWSPPTLPDVESREALLAMTGASLIESDGEPAALPDDSAYLPVVPADGLTVRTQTIRSAPDGNDIRLQILTPDGAGPFPCVYYIHGGGMMAASCTDPNYRAWGRLIAGFGVVVVQVDFRNALFPSSVREVAPYPAGLNDCVAGLRWVHANAAALGIDPARIVVEGESGGANLAIATLLRLKRDGDLGLVAGLYVACPYLAGAWPGAPGSSALANADILVDVRTNFGAMAYGIAALDARDPLAWPGFASEDDLAGFPPTVVMVNECDPLRDDGVEFFRKLLRAGVSARAKELLGTVHGTEVYILCCPDISRDEARSIAAFAAG